MTRPREEWKHDVSGRYKALEKFSKEDARLQFLRILRSLPYGLSSNLFAIFLSLSSDMMDRERSPFLLILPYSGPEVSLKR